MYDNDGSYPLERDDLRLFVEFDVSDRYLLALRWRSLDYDEDAFDDYEADIVEAALGVRW